MIPFHKIFNITPNQFKDGWASFDEINYNQLCQAVGCGCVVKTDSGPYIKTMEVLIQYPDLMCFGRISEGGTIIIEGITGFPSDDICVKFINHAFEKATRKRVGNDYIFIEF